MLRPCVLHHVWESLEPKLWESFEKFSFPNRWNKHGTPHFWGAKRSVKTHGTTYPPGCHSPGPRMKTSMFREIWIPNEIFIFVTGILGGSRTYSRHDQPVHTKILPAHWWNDSQLNEAWQSNTKSRCWGSGQMGCTWGWWKRCVLFGKPSLQLILYYPLALFGFSRVSIVIHERFYRFFLEGTQFVLRVHHLKTDHDTLFKWFNIANFRNAENMFLTCLVGSSRKLAFGEGII